MAELILPRRLREGDEVALVAPAGPVEPEQVEGGVALLQSFGLKVRVRDDITDRERYLAGSDRRRSEELSEALSDPQVRGVFLARGGYGTQRIVTDLELSASVEPKPVVGFSDNTALLAFIQRTLGWAVLHAPHPGPGRDEEYAEVMECLQRGWMPRFDGLKSLSGGDPVEGPVAGGCLALLSTSVGTPAAPQVAGRILFIEDTAEPPYRLDRMLNHLTQAGWFEDAAAVVFGEPGAFAPEEVDVADVKAVLADFASRVAVPVVTGLPCGHVEHHRPLPLGPTARLDPEAGVLEFTEAVVS